MCSNANHFEISQGCVSVFLVKCRWIEVGGLGGKARLKENPSAQWKADYSDSVVPVGLHCKMYCIMQQGLDLVQIESNGKVKRTALYSMSHWLDNFFLILKAPASPCSYSTCHLAA